MGRARLRQLRHARGGPVAFECREQDRKHVNEDTAYIETGRRRDRRAACRWATRGNLVVTSLHRSIPPIIRYNLRDC